MWRLLYLSLIWQFVSVANLEAQAVRIKDGTVFEKAILPILQERCMKCHGPDKAKGKLQLHTKEVIQNSDGLIVPRNLDESELIYRIALPLNDPDDEKMPPSDEPNQMTADEIWLIKWWVFNGASYNQKLSDVPNTDLGRDPLLRVLKHYALHPPGTSMLKPKPIEEVAEQNVPPENAPAQPVQAAQNGPRKWGSLYEEAIDPLFEHNCGKCHGESRASAKLRLNTPEGIQAGGKNGPVLVSGNPRGSMMVERMHLPEGDDSRMPPTEENRQLKPQEIALISWWIQAGARYDTPLNSAPRNHIETIKTVIAESDARKAAAMAGPKVAFKVKEADAAGMDAVEKLGVRVVKRAPGSNALAIHCDDMASEISDQSLAVIANIAPQVVWLNLAKTRVSDDGLEILERFPEIRRMHLDRTKVGDRAISHIVKLPKLEYLNLFGTNITDNGLRQLSNMQTLRKVFTAETQVTMAGVQAAKATNPNLNIISGMIEIPSELPPGSIGTVVGANDAGIGPVQRVDPTPVNAMCPIKPDRPINLSRTTVFEGKTIGLCCGSCLAKFNDNPSAFINKVVITRQPQVMAAANQGNPTPSVPAAPMKVSFGNRTWTNRDGRTLNGSLFSLRGNIAVLNIGGVTYQVPIENLSPEDVQYIEQWKQAKGIK